MYGIPLLDVQKGSPTESSVAVIFKQKHLKSADSYKNYSDVTCYTLFVLLQQHKKNTNLHIDNKMIWMVNW